VRLCLTPSINFRVSDGKKLTLRFVVCRRFRKLLSVGSQTLEEKSHEVRTFLSLFFLDLFRTY
jgi:hypothetical protein